MIVWLLRDKSGGIIMVESCGDEFRQKIGFGVFDLRILLKTIQAVVVKIYRRLLNDDFMYK